MGSPDFPAFDDLLTGGILLTVYIYGQRDVMSFIVARQCELTVLQVASYQTVRQPCEPQAGKRAGPQSLRVSASGVRHQPIGNACKCRMALQ
jgi:hypothetical protein